MCDCHRMRLSDSSLLFVHFEVSKFIIIIIIIIIIIKRLTLR